MTLKHAKELQEFGEKIDVKVSIHERGDETAWITFRDHEVSDFVIGFKLLKQIQETELVHDHSSLVY